MTTGTDVLRQATQVRIKRKDYGRVANAIGVHGDRLIEFAEGRRDLSPDIKKKLAVELFHHSEWDEVRDMMMPANRNPPKPLRTGYPPPASNPNWIKPEWTGGPQPAVKPKVTKPTQRPGSA